MSSGQTIAAPTLEQLIDDGLQQAAADSHCCWESDLSRIVASYVSSVLPYHLLAYGPVSSVSTFASLPLLLARLHQHRGGPPAKKQKLAQGDTATSTVDVSATVDEMEDEVRSMLRKQGRVYGNPKEGAIFQRRRHTSEWGVVQGEHVTLKREVEDERNCHSLCWWRLPPPHCQPPMPTPPCRSHSPPPPHRLPRPLQSQCPLFDSLSRCFS